MCFLHLPVMWVQPCKACDSDYDDDAICLARAAKIVRRDMLKLQSTFTGTLSSEVSTQLTVNINFHDSQVS